MPRYVSLLRSINVGGHRVTMDELRRHFAALRFTRIDTFIASGNVLFNTASTNVAALEARIERHLTHALGYAVPAFIRTLPELATVVEFRPFAPDDMADEALSRYVLFVRTALNDELRRSIAGVSAATDEFIAHGREIHWLCRGRISEPSPAAKAFEKILRAARIDATSRNIKMLQRLVAQETTSESGTGDPPTPAPSLTRAGTKRADRVRKA